MKDINWKTNYNEDVIEALKELKIEKDLNIDVIQSDYDKLIKKYAKAKAIKALWGEMLYRSSKLKDSKEEIEAESNYNELSNEIDKFEADNKLRVVKIGHEISIINELLVRYTK